MSLKKYPIWSAVALILVVLILSLPVLAAVNVGDKAPDFSLRSVDGRGSVKLSTYFGKPMLVLFWASWCPHCRTELPIAQKIYNDLHPRGVEAVGVSLDNNISDAQKFVKQKSITFPIAYGGTDQGLKLVETYGVRGIPIIFVLDKNGVVKTILKGDSSGKTIRDALEKLGLK